MTNPADLPWANKVGASSWADSTRAPPISVISWNFPSNFNTLVKNMTLLDTKKHPTHHAGEVDHSCSIHSCSTVDRRPGAEVLARFGSRIARSETWTRIPSRSVRPAPSEWRSLLKEKRIQRMQRIPKRTLKEPTCGRLLEQT